MTSRRVRLGDRAWEADGARLAVGVAAVQQELKVTAAFPADVEAEARRMSREHARPDLDRADLPFVTIDPATSRDLDQAMHLEKTSDGFTVHYAIADVAAFVPPGGVLEAETFKRGETLYGADSKLPLHPKVLSEGAASLLPDQTRPALLWTIRLDEDGELTDVHVERAMVRSVAKLSYLDVQEQFEKGSVSPMLGLLKDVGERRLALEAKRGGVSLPLPEQEIEVDADGHWELNYRTQVPVEQWNAEISLLTGIGAAKLMLEHGTGLLRTLPPADPRDLERLKRVARGLGVAWPDGLSYPDFIRSVDPSAPAGAAVLVAATRTLRGAGYVGFNGTIPDYTSHSAIAAPYAHVTAPLRRLIDRFAGEICVSICAGVLMPEWVLSRLDELPDVMRDADRKAGQYEGALLDLVEASVLAEHVGERFDATIVSVDEKDSTRGQLMIKEPAIEARCTSTKPLPLGENVSARLAAADPLSRSVAFVLDQA